MPNPSNFWCVPNSAGNGWFVQQEGNPNPLAVFDTQQAAWDDTQRRARAARGESFLQGRDGKIRQRNSFGNDPHPPVDTR